MSSGLIFITGATGFVGGTTAHEALKAGYHLRISVRKEWQIKKLKGIFSDYLDHLEFIIVPDITEHAAFAGKLDGVDYVLHHASPLAGGTDKQQLFPPAVKGTTRILEEAAKIPKDNGWDFSVDQDADFTGDNDAVTAMKLYQASKLLANRASWDFMEKEKPHFSLVTIHPSFIYGHNILQLTAEELKGSTNGMLFGAIMTGIPTGSLSYVHVRDVAEAHVKALNPNIKNGSKYLLSGPKVSWKDIVDILQKKYPKVNWKLKADTPGASWPTDTTKAEMELGMKWRSLEEIVSEVMDQQLGFLNNNASNI
ncbi:MAG: hypothetical protein M1834_008466 [Cirrosporium novae-zelandiae]|nr:MAG: hypothetical protein M1834_008466 [Cirrosporium novae-zelandiae]